MASFQVVRFPITPAHTAAAYVVLNSARPAVLPFVEPVRPSQPALAPRAVAGGGSSLPALAVPQSRSRTHRMHPSPSLRVRHHSAIVPVMRSGSRSLFFPRVWPNPSLNADVPGAWLRHRIG